MFTNKNKYSGSFFSLFISADRISQLPHKIEYAWHIPDSKMIFPLDCCSENHLTFAFEIEMQIYLSERMKLIRLISLLWS